MVMGDLISSSGWVIIGFLFIDIEGLVVVCVGDCVICLLYDGIFLIV